MIDIEDSTQRYLKNLENIRKYGMSDNDLQYLLNIYTHQIKSINNYKVKIKEHEEALLQYNKKTFINNRTCVPIERRFIEIVYVDSFTAKITINPCSGRVTLKIPNIYKGGLLHEKCYKSLLSMVVENEFYPVTYRGKIKHISGCFYIKMMSESKYFKFDSHSFEIKYQE